MKRLLCLAIFIFTATPVFAVKMSSLYQAEVLVPSQTEELKEQAIQDGFLQVLTKVSGDAAIEQNPLIKSSINKAAYYVQEYSYSQPTTSSSEYILRIRYEPEDILRLLNRANIAYWRENRPLILVWLVDQDAEEAAIIGSETPGDFLEPMKQQAKKLGLPLIFPMMDVTDMNQVSPTDVSKLNLPVLESAAKRYSPDALLIGNLAKTNDGIQSQWQLILGKHEWTWKISDKTDENIISTITSQISQTLAKQYVVKISSGPTAWFRLIISNVTEGTDLTSLMQYLEQLTPVKQVRLLQITGDTVQIAVLISGSQDGFEQSAVIGQHLVLKETNADIQQITYQWVR